MSDPLTKDENYVCPQCGPDPAGSEEHARTHHTFIGMFGCSPVSGEPVARTSKTVDDFDVDLARLERIRSGGGLTADCAFLLSFIDKLWAEYTRTLRRADETNSQRLATDEIRYLACCDSFVRESVSEFCAACGYTNLDHLRRRAQKASGNPAKHGDFWYVEELSGGAWRRSAVGHSWALEADARQQCEQLRRRDGGKIFRVVQNGNEDFRRGGLCPQRGCQLEADHSGEHKLATEKSHEQAPDV